VKRILCYGDSNTWGQSDHDTRYPEGDQWPLALQRHLGEDYHIIQEGLGGRNAGNFETAELYRNGQDPFEVIYRSASPVDVLIVSLGTNDLKTKYARSAGQIATDLWWYERMVTGDLAEYNNGRQTKTLYVCPAQFSDVDGYFQGDQSVRSELITAMGQFDAPVVTADELPISADGVHYAPEGHHILAQKLATKIVEVLA